MAEPIFTVANQLTMLRMALVPAFLLLTLGREFTWALVVFSFGYLSVVRIRAPL